MHGDANAQSWSAMTSASSRPPCSRLRTLVHAIRIPARSLALALAHPGCCTCKGVSLMKTDGSPPANHDHPLPTQHQPTPLQPPAGSIHPHAAACACACACNSRRGKKKQDDEGIFFFVLRGPSQPIPASPRLPTYKYASSPSDMPTKSNSAPIGGTGPPRAWERYG